jgi:hypothetical protein
LKNNTHGKGGAGTIVIGRLNANEYPEPTTSFSALTTAIDSPGDRVHVTGGGKKEGVPTVILANPRRSSR